MLFGFRSRFVDPILAGTKDQTIRKERKDGKRPKVGERLYLYTGLRTKQCRKIGEAVCVGVLDFYLDEEQIKVNGKFIGFTGDGFAQRDGFKDYEEFIEYFTQMHGTEPFHGFVTRWKEFKKA